MLFFPRCPPQFCEFRSARLTSYLHIISRETKSEPFFFTQVTVAVVCVPDISIGRMARTIKKGLLSICGLVHDQLRGKKTHPKSITYYPVTLNGAWPIYRFGSNLAGRMYNSVCVMKTSGKVSTQTGHPSPCTPQSGRTYATRGRDGMRRDTRIIQGLVWITRQLKHVKWTGVHLFADFVQRFSPPL